MFLGRGKVI